MSAHLSRERLLTSAARIADDLRGRRIYAKDGSVTWLGPKFSPEQKRYVAIPIPPHMYGGAAGIALFFAAAERVLGGGEYGELSREILSPLRRKLGEIAGDPERARQSRIPIAGMTGLGSYLYCFLKCGQFLDEPALIKEAAALVRLFTPEKVAADGTLDVVTGSAGALLALLALHREAPAGEGTGPSPLEAARTCAAHLLRQRASFEGRPLAWPWPGNDNRAPLTGYSHGAAGISCALLRLYGETGEPELRDAAREGMEFERTLFSPEKKNWLDLRWSFPYYGSAWCHGAPGVGLARLGALDIADDPVIRGEIAAALETTLAVEPSWFDFLCCGNMGLAEILFYGYQRLGAPRLLDAVHEITGFVLQRSEENGGFGWQAQEWENVYDPSLVRGAAGIGYTLLRLAEPGLLPCVLLFE